MTQEAQNAEKVDWDNEVPKDSGSNNSSNGNEDRVKQEWMKFPAPGKYHIRLVGKAVKYLKHGDPPFPFPKRIITHGSFKGEDPAWNAKFYPSVFYAQFCIDRTDGRVKILDRSKKFFEAIRDYKINNDVDPGGKEAGDFVVTVVWPQGEDGKPNKRRAQYSVSPIMKASPFTEEEMAEIQRVCAKQKRKVVDEDGNETEIKVSPLEVIYRSNTLEQIQEAWDALPEDAKVKKERKKDDEDNDDTQKGESPVTDAEDTSSMEKEVVAVAEGDDDLFGDDEETGF